MRITLCTVFLLAALIVSSARGQERENSGEKDQENSGEKERGNSGETSYEDNNESNEESGSQNDDDSDDDAPWWTRLFATMKKFFRDILSLFKEFKTQFEEKTRGIVVWTEEMWAGMKKEMNQWIDDYDYATDEEKQEMRVFIERLEMPKESEEDYYD